MDSLIISTERLISSSEARNKFGKLLKDIAGNESSYYVILDNGKVSALLVHPNWLKDEEKDGFPDLEKLREDWDRHSKPVARALDTIMSMNKKQLPSLLQ